MKAIATLTGRVVDYLNPSAESINAEDLAAGLGSMPRFSGQTIRPYSVAQHSLLVASLVEPKFQLHALLHDAPEAFLGDLPTPAKDAMRALSYMRGHSQSPYDILERAFYKAIARRFGLEEDFVPDAVKEADAIALAIEAPLLQPIGWRLPLWDPVRATPVEPRWRKYCEILGTLPGGGRHEWLIWVPRLTRGGRVD